MSAASKNPQVDADKVDEVIAVVQDLALSVRANTDKNERDRWLANNGRKIVKGLVILAILNLVILIAVGILSIGNHQQATSNHRTALLISGCIVPTGECAQRNGQKTAAVILSVTYRTEAERLKTEIQVANAKGDDVGAAQRSIRLDVVQKDIAATDKVIYDIDHDVDPATDPETKLVQ